jgi:hypothetical protein
VKHQLRFAVFADLHHYPGVFHTQARERLQCILERARQASADCVISLGDFCHAPGRYPEIAEDFRAAGLPVFHALGNHDTDNGSLAEALETYKMPHQYYYIDLKGFRLIFIDSNYYRHAGGHTHFEFRNYFDFPETRETLPPEQISWLQDCIMSSPHPCIILGHASIEREGGRGIRNREQILKIFRRANAGKRRVIMALNGHYHRNNLRILENVAYFDVNSASFDWLNQPHRLFPESLCRQYEMVQHQVIYSEALSAIVSLSQQGDIQIEGSQAGFLHDVRREMTGNTVLDPAGRPCQAEILSAKLKLY